jgi:preprotein translocase subunit SecE
MNIMKIYHDARTEVRKVIFPTKEQIRNSFIAVFVVVTVVTVFLALVDVVMSLILDSVI